MNKSGIYDYFLFFFFYEKKKRIKKHLLHCNSPRYVLNQKGRERRCAENESFSQADFVKTDAVGRQALFFIRKRNFPSDERQRERFLYDGDESAYGQIAITELSRQRDTPAK